MRRKHPTSRGRVAAAACFLGSSAFVVRCSLLFLCFSLCPAGFGATTDSTNADVSLSPPPVVQDTARGLYNAGTAKLLAGKWHEAESQLAASLAKQDERLQPAALFNLGYVRFAQGSEELQKAPPSGAVSQRARAAAVVGGDAIQKAKDALASNDVQQMVQAYVFGRGVRKEMRAAATAVQRAMEVYGKTLAKWRRSLGDFQSAAELNPADTNAAHNAEFVAQAIAKLVDSLREMQQAAAGLNGELPELTGLLSQLKGRIPAANAPPGDSGDDGEEGEDGKGPLPESLTGLQESPTDGGKEPGLKISPEAAAQLLNGIQSGGKQLPMGQGEADKSQDRSGRIW